MESGVDWRLPENDWIAAAIFPWENEKQKPAPGTYYI